MTSPLRPYQQAAIDKVLSTPAPHAQLLAHPMASGKTRTAIELIKRLQPQRTLVVTPALVRPAWQRQFAQWAPELEVGLIAHGRKARNLTKAQVAERDAAFQSSIQIVSYQLLKETEDTGWDMVVVDEAHRLRNPISAQSKLVRNRCRLNLGAHVLLMTGTIIPSEVRQIWNPVDMVQPGWYGLPQRNGKEPWRFLQTFCHRVETEYGVDFRGFNKDKEVYLKGLLSPWMHEVSEDEVAPFLPPLYVEPLHIDDGKEDLAIVEDWLEDVTAEVTHVSIHCHLNDTRKRVVAHLQGQRIPVIEIDATAHDAQSRDMLLLKAKELPRAILVSTTHALNEGISLSFIKAGLVLEWTSDMAGVMQFIRRFARQDAATQMPTYLQFVVRPEDENKATTLSRRVADKNAVLLSGKTDTFVTNFTTSCVYSDTELEAMAAAAFQSYTDKSEFEDGDDDDSDSQNSAEN